MSLGKGLAVGNRLISDGYNSIQELVNDLPGEPVYSALIEVFDGNRETGEDFNVEIVRLYQYAVEFDGVLAARLSWKQLILFSTSSIKLTELMLPKLIARAETTVSNRAIFETTVGPAEHRYFRIDSMGMQLSKLEYWSKPVYAGYYLNGQYKEIGS